MDNSNVKIAWIGLAGVVAAALIAAGVQLLNNHSDSDDKPPIKIHTEGDNSPAISGVKGDVIIGNANKSTQTTQED